ncbi:hypothetical protein WJX79_004926 [Trebouxia sp. C0005]
METRRSKRKEAAASESLPPEPRSKRARRAPAESKAKANTNTKAKAEIPNAGTSESADQSTVQGPIPAVPTTTDSVPGPAASEPPEASASKLNEAEDRKSDADLEKQMGARKDLAEAQERAAMEQERRAAELFGTAQAAGLGGLFSRFGDSLGGPLSSSKLKGIMASLKEDDEMVQEAALNELTELMSMSSEEALTVLPLEQLVPQLISLLNAEHNSQLMLLGARNLTLLADVLPTICSSIVRHGAVPALCARLMTIEYIDLAEQSLQALEKISHEHPAACLRHGGLLASLSYLDFFQTGVQRVAVATAANMCRSVTSENTDAVASAIPILTNLLQYQDAKVVDNACLALSRIAEAFAHRPASLNMLCEFGLISNAVQLISVSDTGSMTSQLSVSTYYGLVKLLSTCVTGSHTVAENLLQSGISDTLRNLLRSSTLFSTSTTNAVSVLRSSDQLHEVVTLACELLPPLPDASTVMLANLPSVPQIPQDCRGADESGSAAEKEDCLRTRFLQEHPETLQRFTADLLPLLLQVYGSTVLDKVRNQCLATVTKIIHFSEPKALGGELGDLPISSFIAGLLTQKDVTIVAKALQLAEILMHKLPVIFSKYFVKEGVVHAVEQLAASVPQLAGEEKAKSKAAKRASQQLKNKEKEEAKANKAGKPEASILEADTPSAAAGASPKPNPSQTLQGKDGAPPMQSLVSKLQSVLASLETFTVSEPTAPPRSAGLRFASGHTYGASRGYRSFGSGDGSSLSSGLAALTQPFKLRLARADHEKQLKDYATNVVLIEPLASMTAVEDFLWSKVYRSSASPPPSAVPTTASQPAAAGGTASAATNVAVQQAELAVLWRKRTRMYWMKTWRKALGPDYDMMQEEALAAASRSVEALQAAVAGSMDPGSVDSADQMEEDEEIDDEIDPDDDEEELALRQPTVHDVHVGGESAPTAGVSGRDTLPNPSRSGLSQYVSGLVSTDEATAAAAQAAIAAVAAVDLAAAAAAGANRQRAQARVPVASTAAAATSSYAQATDATRAGQTKLRFYLAGKLVPSTFTIFQAVQLVQKQRQAEEEANAQGAGLQAEPCEAVAAALAGRPQRRLWEDIYTISYSRYENMEDSVEQADSAMAGLAQLTLGAPPPNCRDPLKDSPLAELLYPALPQSLHAPTLVQDVLLVLKLLECMNRCGAHLASYEEGLKGRTDNSKKLVKHNQVGREEFTSNKLAPKLAQQLKDVLAICGGTLPSWCSQLLFCCKFLFPFDIRRRYFYCTAFGLARALHHLQQLQNAEGGAAPNVDREARELRVGRLTRQKVRVSRKNMLLSAEKVMETYASHRAVLELEYFGEVGTGLGPTLEFYTLLSHELQRKGLGMWRSDTGKDSEAAAAQGTPKKPTAGADIKASNPDQPHVAALQSDIALDGQLQQFVTAPQGLFPAPLPPHLLADSKVLSHFKLLGRAMAKALQDNRLLDLPLSYVFYRKALGQPLDLYDIRKFDAALGATLEKLYAAHKGHQAQGGSRKGPMLVDGCPIEDLCLTFVLPGYPEYELKKNGGDIMVDATNVGAYISAVVDANLESGIKTQMEHFRTGFNEVFPLDALKCFFEDEIEAMMCGTGEKWTVEALTDTIKFDHGYTASSTAVGYFLDILTELDAADQRRFLRFVTGSPRLPPGGIAALHPRLTVVRKHSSLTPEQAQSLGSSASPMAGSLGHQGSVSVLSDGDLPSVMTCANYIKLPPYSSKVVMKERVLYAIREGQGSFDLS